MSTTKRNGNIEILRFIFSLFIILVHFCNKDRYGFGATGYLGVDFFFIISGFFLGKKLKKEKELHSKEPLIKTLIASKDYTLSRIISIYPFYFVAVVFFYIMEVLFKSVSVLSGALYCVSDFLFLQIFGFPSISYTGTLWFLSALFFSLFILYPIVRRYYNVYIVYFSLPVILLSYGYIIRKCGCFSVDPFFDNLLINPGILCAIAGLTLGLIANELTDKIKTINFSLLGKSILSLFELGCYLFVFLYMFFVSESSFPHNFDFVAVGVVFLGIVITTCEQTIFYGKFNNSFSMFLGKSSMILFMTHYFWVHSIRYVLETVISTDGLSNIHIIIIGYMLSFLTGIIVYLGGLAIKKFFVFLKNRILVK